jgi:uncharacterized membrane protein YfbV (UPF0208 family)
MKGVKIMWNNELISSITLGATATVPIVVALTQIVKMTNWVAPKYMPFIAILMGIIVSFLFANEFQDFSANILSGILFGLAGSGLYSGLKASTHAFQVEQNNKYNDKRK